MLTKRASRVPPRSVGSRATGASNHIRTTRILSLSEDLPMVIVIVDEEDRVRGFLPQLDELIGEGLVIVEPVDVIRYVGRGHEPR